MAANFALAGEILRENFGEAALALARLDARVAALEEERGGGAPPGDGGRATPAGARGRPETSSPARPGGLAGGGGPLQGPALRPNAHPGRPAVSGELDPFDLPCAPAPTPAGRLALPEELEPFAAPRATGACPYSDWWAQSVREGRILGSDIPLDEKGGRFVSYWELAEAFVAHAGPPRTEHAETIDTSAGNFMLSGLLGYIAAIPMPPLGDYDPLEEQISRANGFRPQRVPYIVKRLERPRGSGRDPLAVYVSGDKLLPRGVYVRLIREVWPDFMLWADARALQPGWSSVATWWARHLLEVAAGDPEVTWKFALAQWRYASHSPLAIETAYEQYRREAPPGPRVDERTFIAEFRELTGASPEVILPAGARRADGSDVPVQLRRCFVMKPWGALLQRFREAAGAPHFLAGPYGDA